MAFTVGPESPTMPTHTLEMLRTQRLLNPTMSIHTLGMLKNSSSSFQETWNASGAPLWLLEWYCLHIERPEHLEAADHEGGIDTIKKE